MSSPMTSTMPDSPAVPCDGSHSDLGPDLAGRRASDLPWPLSKMRTIRASGANHPRPQVAEHDGDAVGAAARPSAASPSRGASKITERVWMFDM